LVGEPREQGPAAVADVAAEADVGEGPAARLGVHPRGRDAKQRRYLAGDEEVVVGGRRGRLGSGGDGHVDIDARQCGSGSSSASVVRLQRLRFLCLTLTSNGMTTC
jgi:hypothetical protein